MHACLSYTGALSYLDTIHKSAQKQAATTGQIRPTKREPKKDCIPNHFLARGASSISYIPFSQN